MGNDIPVCKFSALGNACQLNRNVSAEGHLKYFVSDLEILQNHYMNMQLFQFVYKNLVLSTELIM